MEGADDGGGGGPRAEGQAGPEPGPARGPGSRKAKYAADKARKENVVDMINRGEYSLLLIDEENPHQSPAWKKFAQVIDAAGKKIKFVKCRGACGKVKMLTSGRGNLADHKCEEPGPRPVIPPTQSQVKEFQRSLAGLCSAKFITPTLVQEEVFLTLIQAAIKIGAECGMVKAAEIVPCANTISAVTKTLADKGRKYLIEKVKHDVEDGLVSGSLDGWDGGGLRKRKFYCQTLSTINEDFELSDHVLFTTHCDAESVTSAIIREAVDSSFARLQLPGEKVSE